MRVVKYHSRVTRQSIFGYNRTTAVNVFSTKPRSAVPSDVSTIHTASKLPAVTAKRQAQSYVFCHVELVINNK